MPVAVLKRRITYKHFRELVAYEVNNPDGFLRLELYLAKLTATLINVNIDTTKANPVTAEDMLIDFSKRGKKPKEMSLEATDLLLGALLG